jgi:23S rRNA pseudouridine1911/1915/1917 synthase
MKITYKQDTKERLDKFLSLELPQLTRSQLKKMILSELVLVNDEIATVHRWLKNKDVVKLLKTAPEKRIEKKLIAPQILAQTKDYLILEKPAGLLVHPTDRNETNTLADWLRTEFPQVKKVGDEPMRPGIVHRLDKDVSGLMVVALNNDAFDFIKKQFQDRTVKKEYLALVHGSMRANSGEIDTPIERSKETGLMKANKMAEVSKTAITIYNVEKKFVNYTLLRLQIKTGRTHQIRTHLYSIGHSIVGDSLYRTKDLRKKKKTIENLRIFLHAAYLEFTDLENNRQKYSSSLPSLLKDFLNTIK